MTTRWVGLTKVRHANARNRVDVQAREQQRWLASLTPEHRAAHERNTGWPCGECIGAGIDRLNASIARWKAQRDRHHRT